ncbi:tripartite tricarboxylate transporter substrate binding protein [Variovorax ginsengisoli]|uniref:Tripartite tricarboxylate transporter substrate binding protein n=1 Tax=Variovorax ginsengisoli TaxID=363844 RepID=A0ABT8SCU1_9BURK|nr:tripartite tricarboxylate transporter substrate binding protein [Variovorax ginsengisoli]MDN8617445.1 tripartite tricarboxylate transporter substrate binding protein [Variovorax ginsengisoli]MDO1536615.1 tripartite tricarboxylate transporter substrate binding protein [Variovorax ginsengisoli]
MKLVCTSRRRYLAACIVAAAALPFVTLVHAQLPSSSRPLVMRVAYPAGGPADVAARKIQLPLQAALGKPVIIENLPGAGGSIAANNVLHATPDGQTLLVTTGNDMILSPLALAQVKYKPEQYRLLATILPTDFTLVTSANHAFPSVDALIERARRSDQKELTIGSWGYGSAPYLVGADFSASTNARVMDVPYKGAAPVIQALLSREIDLAFVPLAPNVLELIRTGKINAIGVANTKRNPYLPQLPTLSEGKYLKNFVYSAWAAVFVPASAPEPVVAALHKNLAEITGSSDFQGFLKDSAALPVEPMTPAQSAAFYQAEIDKFRRIAKAVKLEPQ